MLIDWLTRYVIAVPIPDTKTTTVLEAIEEQLILMHGCPKRIKTDNASNFRSEIVRGRNQGI